MNAPQTVTISAIVETTRSSTTVYVKVAGIHTEGQFLFKGKDHASRAAMLAVQVTGTFEPMTAIVTISDAQSHTAPAMAPPFGFAATIIMTAA